MPSQRRDLRRVRDNIQRLRPSGKRPWIFGYCANQTGLDSRPHRRSVVQVRIRSHYYRHAGSLTVIAEFLRPFPSIQPCFVRPGALSLFAVSPGKPNGIPVGLP